MAGSFSPCLEHPLLFPTHVEGQGFWGLMPLPQLPPSSLTPAARLSGEGPVSQGLARVAHLPLTGSALCGTAYVMELHLTPPGILPGAAQFSGQDQQTLPQLVPYMFRES